MKSDDKAGVLTNGPGLSANLNNLGGTGNWTKTDNLDFSQAWKASLKIHHVTWNYIAISFGRGDLCNHTHHL